MLLVLCALIIPLNQAFALNLEGRLGVGFTNQVVTGIEALSVKLQQDPMNAIGFIAGLDSGEDNSSYALGGKYYRLIYDEPQLNFYSGLSAVYFSYPDPDDSSDTLTGHQLEASLGTEFSFSGLESIGFSFEFGIGVFQYDQESSFKTRGQNILLSAVHFYL